VAGSRLVSVAEHGASLRVDLRLAYADPPYPDQAERLYGDHPDYNGEVDHAQLVERLAAYDAWALSTGARSLQLVLALCPPGVRVASWRKPNSPHPGYMGTWWWTWEPVIINAGRPSAEPVQDSLVLPFPTKLNGARFVGQKPAGFCEWVFRLMGAEPTDELDDLFPGSGAVGRAWDRFAAQLSLFGAA
jgi:hypothetical protein